MLVNLTPHDIRVFSAKTGEIIAEITPSGTIARVEMAQRQVDTAPIAVESFGHSGEIWEYDIPIVATNPAGVSGLPNEQNGVRYIVSAMVRCACPDRLDLVSPANLVRDEVGNVVGCSAFEVNPA